MRILINMIEVKDTLTEFIKRCGNSIAAQCGEYATADDSQVMYWYHANLKASALITEMYAYDSAPPRYTSIIDAIYVAIIDMSIPYDSVKEITVGSNYVILNLEGYINE